MNDEKFEDDDRQDLLDRGFSNELIEWIEGLGLGNQQFYFNICNELDNGASIEEVEEHIREYLAEPAPDAPQTGGKRINKSIRNNKNNKNNKNSKKGSIRKSIRKSKNSNKRRRSNKRIKSIKRRR